MALGMCLKSGSWAVIHQLLANRIFKQRVLYGREAEQRYQVFAVDVEIHDLGARDLLGSTKAVFKVHFDVPDIFKTHRQPDHILRNSGRDQRIGIDT